MNADSQWVRLAGAAVAARDELRRLDTELSDALAAGSVPRALIVRARDAARRHAAGLRIGLKHPSTPVPSVRRMNRGNQ